MTELLEDGSTGGESWQGKAFEEPEHSCCEWYFAREYIESSSPSRQDGIDAAKEAYLRKSYCTFLQDLGMRLKVPQVTIATAIMFCHRFFLRKSHAKNDRYVIATVCMFLAGKVEETPKLLQNVICVAYEIRHRKDPAAVQRIKMKEVLEQEKELALLAEYLVLSTLEFDLNIHHPYKPLVAAIKKFKVAQHALAQVAWNFINDGLRTSLCLQFKAHQIAAGAIFLAAKFLKVKLPAIGKKPWWQEFDVTPRQLEDVSNQMLELYEQNREIPATRPAGSMNHDKKAVNALPPGTPQVVEKRSTVDVKPKTAVESSQRPYNQGEAKASSAEFEQVNIEKLKTAVEKRRKLKAEGGGVTKSKLELTDEEELLEREMENGRKDGYPENASHGHVHKNTDHYTHFSNTEGGGSLNVVSYTDMDEDLEIDHVESSSENKSRHSHAKDYHHTSRTQRMEKLDYHHRRPKCRDMQEREHKRSRHEQVN